MLPKSNIHSHTTYADGRNTAGEMVQAALALYRDLPLGWGKRSGGLLKNHLPKGLRRH